MPKYTIRVELEGRPTREEYDKLHQRMQSLGFSQTVNGVQGDKSVVVQLPTGLYYGASDNETSKVSQNVYDQARAIRKVICVFVARTDTWSSRP
jgi:hypothetical protein